MFEANLSLFPFIIPLVTALLLFIIPRKSIAASSLILNLVLTGYTLLSTFDGNTFVSFAGGWVAPYGIALIIDPLASIMLFFSNFIFLITTCYGFKEKESSARLPLIFLLQAGVNLSFTTADFFNLFVAFEVMMTASYVLLALECSQKVKAYQYILLNVIAGFLFLTTAAIVYGLTGNLNLAALQTILSNPENSGIALVIGAAALVIFGMKAGLFPLYYWLPDTYPLLPTSISALFGGVLTKVGVYILLRMFITVLPHNHEFLHQLLLITAGFTMLLGVLGAVSKKSISEILSYHIVSQVGYMALGIGLFTVTSVAATLFFLIHNMVVKSTLILVGGEATRVTGVKNLDAMGALWKTAPFLGIFFLIEALSLAGIPPLSGFLGKILLLMQTIQSEHPILLIVALVTSFFTLFSMVKIWQNAFLGKGEQMVPCCKYALSWIALGCAATLLIGFGSEPIWRVMENASTDLFNTQNYVNALLKEGT